MSFGIFSAGTYGGSSTGGTVFNNPYCQCRQHLGVQDHTNAEHDYAESLMPESDEVSSILVEDNIASTAANWCGGRLVTEIDPFDHEKTFLSVNVPTKRGVQRASRGDYIIQQEDGSFEVMGPADYQRSRSA